ncbi:hypothetical protein BJY52DRAFT_1122937, partial [Lactarius psammicola]
LSGIVFLEHNMCMWSCVAYTGPYGKLNSCPCCSSPWYIPGTTKAQKWFSTIPIGPVIQALFGSCEMAKRMHYLKTKLAKNLRIVRANGGNLAVYNNTPCGQELLDAWSKGCFNVKVSAGTLGATCTNKDRGTRVLCVTIDIVQKSRLRWWDPN